MIIRSLCPQDIDQLVGIHKRNYESEFPFPFADGRAFFDEKFVVTDDFGNIITFGTLEITTEAIVLTDKAYPIRERREALYKLLHGLSFVAQNNGFDMFHCSVIDDPKWSDHLKKVGFKPIKGEYLYYKVEK